jgi:hypothetical protein
MLGGGVGPAWVVRWKGAPQAADQRDTAQQWKGRDGQERNRLCSLLLCPYPALCVPCASAVLRLPLLCLRVFAPASGTGGYQRPGCVLVAFPSLPCPEGTQTQLAVREIRFCAVCAHCSFGPLCSVGQTRNSAEPVGAAS